MSKEKALELCQEFLEGPWKRLSIEDFQFRTFSGGLSNNLYHCALSENVAIKSHGKKKVPKEVLLRTYGPLQDSQDTITREAVIFTLLSERNLGPKLYGIFPGGRIEEFLPSRTLNDWNDIRLLLPNIATEMAKIHALQVPISKKPIFHEKIYEWLEFMEKIITKDDYAFAYRILSTGEYRREVQWLENQIAKLDSPIVFCHNDLQGGNILLMNNKKGPNDTNLTLIDFEFGAYNYRGFDLGNHFSESVFTYHLKDGPHTYEVDLKKFPSETDQGIFFDAYLKQMQKEGIIDASDIASEKEKLFKEVEVFRLAAHLFWINWTFKMSYYPITPFPYWEYGKTRYEVYKAHKEEFLQKHCQGK